MAESLDFFLRRELDSNPRPFTRNPAVLRVLHPRLQPICTPIMHSFAPLPQRKSCKIEPAASGENVPAWPAERPVGAGFRKLTNVKSITPRLGQGG